MQSLRHRLELIKVAQLSLQGCGERRERLLLVHEALARFPQRLRLLLDASVLRLHLTQAVHRAANRRLQPFEQRPL